MSGVRPVVRPAALPLPGRGVSLGEQIALLREICAEPAAPDAQLFIMLPASSRAIVAAAATTLETLASDPSKQFAPRKTGVANVD